MGLQSDDQRGRTYGEVGQTPVVRKTGNRFRCNMIAAITNYGTMKWMVFVDTFNVEKFLIFLKRLIFVSIIRVLSVTNEV